MCGQYAGWKTVASKMVVLGLSGRRPAFLRLAVAAAAHEEGSVVQLPSWWAADLAWDPLYSMRCLLPPLHPIGGRPLVSSCSCSTV